MLRAAAMMLVPALILGAVEIGLRLFGYGYPTELFVKTAGRDAYTVNDKYPWQFFPKRTGARPDYVLLPAKKPQGTIRIFILGESTAMGTPDPAFSFGRILEVILRRQHPDRKFEVINAAMRGVNSHVILPIACECAAHEPDLFIVYMGNNEVIGLHGPDPNSWFLRSYLPVLRAGQWVKSSRLGQLFRSWTGSLKRKAAPSEVQDMAFFRKRRLAADDWRREVVYNNFRANLQDICKVAVRSGAAVIACTVADNLKDCPPLGSLHRARLASPENAQWEEAYALGAKAESEGRVEEAIQHFLAAARMDDHFADLHFRLGRCHLATGDFAQGRKHYTLARDWDALQFRTDSQMNEIIRKTATAGKLSGIMLADTERALAENRLSDYGIPGDKLFRDHVHPTFDGDYLLARTVYPAVVEALGEALGKPSPSTAGIPSRQECADALAFTDWDELNVAEAAVQLTSKPPFADQLDHARRQSAAELALKNRQASLREPDIQRALEIYRSAVKQRPEDWKLHFNLGRLYQALSQHGAAVEHFEFAVKTFPHVQPFRVALGAALAQEGKLDAAMVQFIEALRLDPEDTQAKDALAWVRTRMTGAGAVRPK